MRRRRALAAAFPLVATPVAAAGAAPAMPTQRPLERAVVRTINLERAERGMPRLQISHAIARVARRHSADQLRHGRLSHDGGDGTPFAARLARVTRARKVGETVAWLPAHAPAVQVVRLWLASPPHRRQLLDPAYRRVGVGGRMVGSGVVVTADFATGRGSGRARR